MSSATFYENFEDFKWIHQNSRKSFYKNIELKKKWFFMNIYYRKTMKIAKMMGAIIKLDDLVEIGTIYWKMLHEFETWIKQYSMCYHFTWFRLDLSCMLTALIDYLAVTFPAYEKTFRCIDNYPQVSRSNRE
jgi:hypothetical protein